ncbi:hypothetical protein [Flavobacterium sp.]|uniref:hypothetical protein n=1 Tax=Flavobacterium sp. TaxID=239 RepID=UPI0035B436D2
MDFYFYKHKSETVDTKKIEKILSNDEVTIQKNNSIFKYTKNCQTHVDDIHYLFFSGRVLYDNLDFSESKKQFIEDIKNLNWPLPDSIHGYFSGFLNNNDNTYIFTDPIGLYNLFYYFDNDYIVISSSLMAVQKTTNASLNYAGLVLETFEHNSQFSILTPYQGIKRLLPGEFLKITNFQKSENLFDYTIKKEDSVPGKTIAQDLVNLINEENKLLYHDEIIISLSGGIDSRVNLAPLLVNKKKFHAINYGEEDIADSKIPRNISKKFKFNLDIIDPTPNLFPSKDIIDDITSKTTSLFISSWHSIILSNYETNLFLLGDITDILRAKNITSLKNRKFKTNFYINKFLFGKKLKLNPITETNKIGFQESKRKLLINRIENSFLDFKFSDTEKKKILDEILNDFNGLFQHLDNYNCKYIESYEELYGIFTWGRLAMGKQLNILRYKYNTEIPLLNIRILRKVLNIAPSYRYADELTTKMFKTKEWRELGNFPTSQNPIVPYNSSFYLMLLGWFIRSKTDAFLTKLSVKTKGKFKRKRLFKSFDIQKSYDYPGSFDNFKSYFEKNDIIDFDDKINLYKSRMEGTSWPIIPIDLMPYIQIMHFIKNAKKS